MECYKILIVSQSLGVFLNKTETGELVWSKSPDAADYEAAPTFDQNQAGQLLSMFDGIPEDLSYIQVVPDYQETYATPQRCLSSGAQYWLNFNTECAGSLPS